MSSSQRPQRRISTRLQDKEDAPISSHGAHLKGNAKSTGNHSESSRAQVSKHVNGNKRKIDYDEDDDGFLFTRVKRNKPEPKQTEQSEPVGRAQPDGLASQQSEAEAAVRKEEDPKSPARKRKKRLSFSTPKSKDELPVRRSKRLSREHEDRTANPVPKSTSKSKPKEAEGHQAADNISADRQVLSPGKQKRKSLKAVKLDVQPRPQIPSDQQLPPPPPADSQAQPASESVPIQQENDVGTKIALPFADTPIIKRNKAMREGKSGKGERRSSLGLRGRRASSLIETGNSNALPHHEVEISDFYKHIESEGLVEPRRMRQLLTWCATRSLEEKPIGTDFEDASARSAARVIQEELLKDLANRSELSDWFSREDAPVQQKPLPVRPNPKNTQNMEKISELEERIKRLRMEKQSLEFLIQPPRIPDVNQLESIDGALPDRQLLSETDIAALETLQADSMSAHRISQHLNEQYDSLGPTIDTFADGVHKITQYRHAADNVAGRVLSICAERLAQREKDGRRKALPVGDKTPSKDLGGVLRSLSKAER